MHRCISKTIDFVVADEMGRSLPMFRTKPWLRMSFVSDRQRKKSSKKIKDFTSLPCTSPSESSSSLFFLVSLEQKEIWFEYWFGILFWQYRSPESRCSGGWLFIMSRKRFMSTKYKPTSSSSAWRALLYIFLESSVGLNFILNNTQARWMRKAHSPGIVLFRCGSFGSHR